MATFLDRLDIPALVDAFKEEFGAKSIRTYASSAAFCLLLSVLPILIIAASVLPYTPLGEEDVVGFLMLVLPESSEGLVRRACNQAFQASIGILPVSVLFLLWSAGFGMMQFGRGINSINDVTEHRNYFFLRFQGTLYAVIMIALVIAVLFLQIAARQLAELWGLAAPGEDVPGVFTSALRYVVLFVLAALFFLLVFTTMPGERKKPLGQLPGAIVSAVACEVLNGLIALFVDLLPNFNAFYGSLSAVVVLMLWIYWSLYLILFGAFVNRFIEVHVLPALAADK